MLSGFFMTFWMNQIHDVKDYQFIAWNFKDKTVAQISMSISCGEMDRSIQILSFARDAKLWKWKIVMIPA